MIVIKKLDDLKSVYHEEKVQITIGNFDSVHLGHREFLSRIYNECKQCKSKFVVITFVPHPVQILKAKTGFLINTFTERRELLAMCGVDYLLEVDFTRDFSTLSPESFLEKFVFSFSGIDKIYLGHDFVFGANKAGDYQLARKICEKNKIGLVLQDEFRLMSHTISSSVIREALSRGDIENANSLLGRSYFLSGRVIKGQGRGKQIGYPTANIEYDKELIKPSGGVYVTQTVIHDMTYNSVTNVGFNPTFNLDGDVNVETHLLDFDRDIYGEVVRVSFLKKIREEKKFSSVNELVYQIENDVRTTKDHFKSILLG